MKIAANIKSLIFCSILLLLVSGCEKEITDFGNDASISGKVVDQSGNIVAGDITSTALIVKAIGDGDITSTDMRVHGDGTYENKRLFPKKYKIWISGSVTPVTDTFIVDFGSKKSVNQDFTVIPFLTVKPPVVVGSPSSTEVTVSYEITGNGGKTVNKREVYCSNNPYPNASTGDGPFYTTVTVPMDTDNGNVTINGLTSKTKYYLRVGAQASGASAYNYSDQITLTTP